MVLVRVEAIQALVIILICFLMVVINTFEQSEHLLIKELI